MLTATGVKNVRPGDKPAKIFDEKGLYLLVNPNGSRWWRFKYRFGGKEKLLSLGVYPDVSLAEARDRRDGARKQVAAGIDPGAHRKNDIIQALSICQYNRPLEELLHVLVLLCRGMRLSDGGATSN